MNRNATSPVAPAVAAEATNVSAASAAASPRRTRPAGGGAPSVSAATTARRWARCDRPVLALYGDVGQRQPRVRRRGASAYAAGQRAEGAAGAGREGQHVRRAAGATAASPVSGPARRLDRRSRGRWCRSGRTSSRRPAGRPSWAGHGVALGRHGDREPPAAMCGLSSSRCRCGGMAPCCSISTTLISPATPAAASVWPMLVFTEPSSSGRSAGRSRHSAAPSAPHLDRVAEQACRCRGPRRSSRRRRRRRRRPGRRRRRAPATGPLGAVSPPLRPSWFTAEPRMTARTRSPSACGVAQALQDDHAAALGAHVAVGGGVEGLAAAVGAPSSGPARS